MKAHNLRERNPASFRWRVYLLFGLLACAAAGLIWRAVNLQLVDHGFLSSQGAARFSRVVPITAHRGTITDRYGEPLAVSTPVDSVWVKPSELDEVIEAMPEMSESDRSSGVATEAAMVSALAPGSAASIWMVGKSTCGSGATGRKL